MKAPATFRAHVANIHGIVAASRENPSTKLHVGLAGSLAALLVFGVAFGLVRQVVLASPPDVVATYLAGFPVCVFASWVMFRRDLRARRAVILVSFYLALTAAIFLIPAYYWLR